jgi:predicted lysophospholipase L1 biosynthesis ABC-type transport system permease subunit
MPRDAVRADPRVDLVSRRFCLGRVAPESWGEPVTPFHATAIAYGLILLVIVLLFRGAK